jgi:fatty-acyl-CoA synthase
MPFSVFSQVVGSGRIGEVAMPVDVVTTRARVARADASLRELSVGEALREAAADAPDHLAVVDPVSGRRLTYGELLDESERVARALLERFSPGEHVAACMPNLSEFLLLQFGAALAGMVLVPVPPALRGRDLAHILRASHAAGVFFAPEFRGASLTELIGQLRPELAELRDAVSLEDWSAFRKAAPADGKLPLVDPASPSQLQFTSGSTGAPKGALLHHRGIVNSARFVAEDLELGRDDVWLACLPLCYIAGCTITVLAALHARATLVLCDFDPGRVLSLIESEHATVTLLAAAMVQMLLEHEDVSERDLSSLRLVSVGGSAIAPELARQAQAELGVTLTVMYGLTEACGIVTQTRIDDRGEDRIETIGRPHPHVEIKLIDPWSGEEVPPGAAGELLLHGYFVMNGYLDMPEATSEAIDADGWLHTGDLATLDQRGYLRITGRLKEIINRGARKIAPGEIEALLNSHPAVALSAVIGVPDQRLGEEIAAFVRVAPGTTTTGTELAGLCAEQLAAFKRPRHWIFLDEMPLTRSGKVHKPTLREIFDNRLQ